MTELPSANRNLAGILHQLGLKLGSTDSARRKISAANDGIVEGGRNATLASAAGAMRARGMMRKAIETSLLTMNAERCSPPLQEDEVRGIARSISNYAPGSPNDVLRTLNDAGNAQRFAKQWGDRVRYVPELAKWLIWNDELQWEVDSAAAVVEMAKQTATDIYREGDAISDTPVRDNIVRHSKQSQQAPRLGAMLQLAQSIPNLVAPIKTLDADPWVLGVENGTLDLREGALRPPRRQDYITRIAPVRLDRDAQCPTFIKFLNEIMGGDPELVEYMQRLMGYMLTGDTREQRMFFLYGTGANGKSTFLNVCKAILGPELCRQTPAETIMARQGRGGATPELATLHGARAVMTTEVDEGSHLSESLVKQLTGGDPVPARHLFRDPFEYVPWFKLFVAGNHKPQIRGSDEGIWRRIDLIPFEVTIPAEQRDALLAEKLRREVPGIFNWVVAGCRAWQQGGLVAPRAVLAAVDEYRQDMDHLGEWITDACDLQPALEIPSRDAYLYYRGWAEAAGIKPWSNTLFGRKMAERFKRKRTAAANIYCGLGLRQIKAGEHVAKAKTL